jgi:hypothetical protein
MNIRGGQWLIYDNTFTALGYISSPIRFTEYRAGTDNCVEEESPSLCNPGIPQCCGPAEFATWYPLPGQVRGTYVWNNVYGGSSREPEVDGTNYIPTYIQANRDYWIATSLADAKSKGLNAGYTPYAYPHPLGGPSIAPSPPKKLRIVN